MRMRSKRTRLAAVAVGALTAATIVLGTSPASADGTYSGLPYIHGAGSFSDDFGDEGSLSTDTNTPSNAVCFWQEILWADGDLSSGDVDGYFGSTTKAATELWQSQHGVSSDGVVGKGTFGAADAHLYQEGGSSADGQYLYVYYRGGVRDVDFTRNTNGDYGFYNVSATTHYLAGYNYWDC